MNTLLVAQAIIPMGLVLWMMAWPPRSMASIALQVVGSVILLLSLVSVGLWLLPPWWTPHIAAGLITLAGVRHAMRPPHRSVPAGWLGWTGVAVFFAVGAVGLRLALVVRRAASPPAGAKVIDLAWPLGKGRFLVVNGGNAVLLNAHQQSLDTTIVRLRPWRGNGHAVDIIAVDRFGLRAAGLIPTDPAAYRIFGTPVVAPCSGVVVAAVDGLQDMPVPQYDRANMAGNHVILDCQGAHVVLAHFRRTSVCVRVGDAVNAGQLLGAVGNSGGTNEPHLHIHAQRPGPAGALFGGAPLPIRLDGRYLIRGDRVVMGSGVPAQSTRR